MDPYTRQVNVDVGIIPPNLACCSDFMDLFKPGAQWTQAAGQVSVFELSGTSLPLFSDSDLQQIISFLKQHNIDLAISWEPLMPSGGCGRNAVSGFPVEGFVEGPTDQEIITKIQANGGAPKYVVMDEPIYFGNIYNGPGACNWSPQQIATNALTSLSLLKTAFPGVLIGDVEPVPGNAFVSANDWVQRYAAWFDAFQAATGSKLAFLQVDTGFSDNWISAVESLRVETSQRAIPLGMIYNGLQSDLSDFSWISRALQHISDFELSNPQPDQALLESWTAYPITSLPETTPYTFTWLIDQYARPRPSLSLNTTVSPSQATGRLLDRNGVGVASAPITVTLRPTGGAGAVSDYTLTGTVPAGAATALVGIRINDECGCSGTADLALYTFQYGEAGSGSLTARLDFSAGLNGWNVYKGGTAAMAQLEPTTIAPGQDLHLSALPSQLLHLNSNPISVTAGASYTLRVTARVSPQSAGSGYFMIAFLAATELSRQTLSLQSEPVTLGTAQTGSDGSYNLQFQSPTQDYADSEIQADFPGIDYPAANALWPARVTASFGPRPKSHGQLTSQ
jgi:hypothetical protein